MLTKNFIFIGQQTQSQLCDQTLFLASRLDFDL
jgi:hypothetical protein